MAREHWPQRGQRASACVAVSSRSMRVSVVVMVSKRKAASQGSRRFVNIGSVNSRASGRENQNLLLYPVGDEPASPKAPENQFYTGVDTNHDLCPAGARSRTTRR